MTLAAPVTINGTRGYVAVAVKATTNLRYNAHRSMTIEGSTFAKTKGNAEPTLRERDQQKVEQRFTIGSAFVEILSDNDKNVNYEAYVR